MVCFMWHPEHGVARRHWLRWVLLITGGGVCMGRATQMQEKVILLCPQHDVMCVTSSHGTQNLPPPLIDGEAETQRC